MTPLRIIPALLLTACAPITCERVWLDPVTVLYGCERPTATIADEARGEGSSQSAQPGKPDRPDTDGPDKPGTDPEPEPEEPVTDPEPEPEPDVEPNRELDPEGWQGWRDRTPRGSMKPQSR